MNCPYAKSCGGCRIGAMSYEDELKQKLGKVQALLAPFCDVSEMLGADDPCRYRNKVTATFSYAPAGKAASARSQGKTSAAAKSGASRGKTLTTGRYEEGTRRVVPVDDCLIENEAASRVIVAIRELAQSFRFTAFNPSTGDGLLRHIQVRTAHATGQMMVTLVTGQREFPSRKNFAKELRKKCPEITTLLHSVNGAPTGMILGSRVETLYGPGAIEDTLLGCRFRISPQSFYQINSAQTERLYQKALDFAALTGAERVLDAYSGIGTIGICAAKASHEVICCELNPDAVADARRNAKLNNLENVRFEVSDAGDFMVEEAASGRPLDAVFMDPPRAGSDERFLSALVKASPKKIVYISCNPETLARDLRVLTDGGYSVNRAAAVDLFPMTEHVETVCLLSKLTDAKHHVEVELHLDEMNLTSAESKATYDEIRDYVMEQTGLHVTNLNIAQIKRKCGIIERENYNLPKSEDSKQPNCTKEKEEAIKDAFRHFGMI